MSKEKSDVEILANALRVKVFRHSFQMDEKTKAIREKGDPIQKSKMARRVYHEIFNKLKNNGDWKDQTQRITVKSWTEAQLVSEALTYFLGGAEVETLAKGAYKVGSRGYSHYIRSKNNSD